MIIATTLRVPQPFNLAAARLSERARRSQCNRRAGFLGPRTNEGTQCLIHASGRGPTLGQDELLPTGVAPDGTPPITIKGGDNNPNPALQGVTSISRSDSIVTVPIYHRAAAPLNDLCPAGCTLTGTIVGFLQLGIQENAAGTQWTGQGCDHECCRL